MGLTAIGRFIRNRIERGKVQTERTSQANRFIRVIRHGILTTKCDARWWPRWATSWPTYQAIRASATDGLLLFQIFDPRVMIINDYQTCHALLRNFPSRSSSMYLSFVYSVTVQRYQRDLQRQAAKSLWGSCFRILKNADGFEWAAGEKGFQPRWWSDQRNSNVLN